MAFPFLVNKRPAVFVYACRQDTDDYLNAKFAYREITGDNTGGSGREIVLNPDLTWFETQHKLYQVGTIGKIFVFVSNDLDKLPLYKQRLVELLTMMCEQGMLQTYHQPIDEAPDHYISLALAKVSK